MINPMDLTGKRVLVVGCVSGLAKAIIEQLDKLGASMVLVDQDAEGLSQVAGGLDDAKSCCFNYLQVEEIVGRIKESTLFDEKLDGVVYTVTHSDFRPLNLVDPDNLGSIMNDNFNAFVEIIRSLMKRKAINNGASIVVMSSISSIRAMKAKMAFCAAKAATDAAVRCLAAELGPKGIRVNSVQKGGVDVDFEKGHIQSINALNDNATENKQVLGLVKAEEIGNTVAFLLSDAARSITGTAIVVDGGYTL